MLKLKYLYENYGLAKEALENWEHDSDTLDALLSEFRISSNAIYPFSRRGKVCFLRLAPVEEKLLDNVFGELEFIEYLNSNGFPALKPIAALSGGTVLTLDTGWGTYYACAFEKVPGEQIERVGYADDVMEQYGKALGRLHRLSAGFVPKVRKWTHEDVLGRIAEVLSDCGAPSFMRAELDAVRSELSLLPKSAENYGLLHYDFEPDNVFYDNASKTCFVIDFDDGMYNWYALDIMQVFSALEDELSGDGLAAAKSRFIAGYSAEYVYKKDTEALFPLMRRFAELYSYARLIRSVAEKSDGEPDWMLGLRAKLDRAIMAKEARMREAQA